MLNIIDEAVKELDITVEYLIDITRQKILLNVNSKKRYKCKFGRIA